MLDRWQLIAEHTNTKSVDLMKLIAILSFHLVICSEARHVSDGSDLAAAAAEPRPVVLEPPQGRPEVLPLVADISSFSDSALSEASEKVEKILQRPLAFSYDNDQSSEASEFSDEEEKVAKVIEVDQTPDAINYYKYIKNVEPSENDEGAAGSNHDGNGTAEEVDHKEVQNEEESGSERDRYHAVDHNQNESVETDAVGDSDQQSTQVHGHHKHGGGGGGAGGHGGAHEYHKGQGQEHHSSHKGEKGEKGDKGYKGHHHHEKGQKGHHTKENHDNHYEEKGGDKKNHHHDDGYDAEHHKGEKGHKKSKFSEDGKHSKGHSTKGEHSIHKKDEYEKKQEFYDESHEEDGYEKDGEFFHEDDYKKGGHEKGGYDKGGEEEAHHGKKHHHSKGGHFKEDKGHKGTNGHDSHYDHERKHGEHESNSGGKKWSYGKGTGGGGGGGGGGGKHKHSKYEQADASNAPVRIIEPVPNENTVIRKQTPLLVLEQGPVKEPDVIYPPLSNIHLQPLRKVRQKQPHGSQKYFETFPRPLAVAQRRSDDEDIIETAITNDDVVPNSYEKYDRAFKQKKVDKLGVHTGNKEDSDEDNEKQSATRPKSEFTLFESTFKRRQNNTLPNQSNENIDNSSEEDNTDSKYKVYRPTRFDHNVGSSEEYEDLTKQNDEVGAYSVFRIGNYETTSTSTSPPTTSPSRPTQATEGYEKLKQVAIISDNVDHSSLDDTTTSSAEENLDPEETNPITSLPVTEKEDFNTLDEETFASELDFGNTKTPQFLTDLLNKVNRHYKEPENVVTLSTIEPGDDELVATTISPISSNKNFKPPVAIAEESENNKNTEGKSVSDAASNAPVNISASSSAEIGDSRISKILDPENDETSTDVQNTSVKIQRHVKKIKEENEADVKRDDVLTEDVNVISSTMKPIVVEDVSLEETNV